MNCVIVDDDPILRHLLSNYVRKTSFLTLKDVFDNGDEALPYLLSDSPDLVFLDINMPGMSGMDLVKAFSDSPMQVILISAEHTHAIEAFEYNITDYLLKPTTYPRFLKGAVKAHKVFENHIALQPAKDNEHLFAKVNGRLIKIDLQDICFVEALADYLSIYTSSQKYVVHGTMKNMQSKLPEGFIRIHNSYIVNRNKITEIEDHTLTVNKKVLPISRVHQKELKNQLRLL